MRLLPLRAIDHGLWAATFRSVTQKACSNLRSPRSRSHTCTYVVLHKS